MKIGKFHIEAAVLVGIILLPHPLWTADQSASDRTQIEQLFAKAEKMPPVQYESIGNSYVEGKTQPMPSPKAKVWRKGPYQRFEMSGVPSGSAGAVMIF